MEQNKENDIRIEVVRNDGSVHSLAVTSDIDSAYNFSYLYYANCVRCGVIKSAKMIVNGEIFREYPTKLKEE